MHDLKLLALDAEDLAIIAAHLQDAVLTAGDMAYLKGERRFALVANRFDWCEAAKADSKSGKGDGFVRRRTGVRIERVMDAKVLGLDPTKKDTALSLLTVTFEPKTEPGGFVTLHFSGGGAVRLEVECIEAALEDLGAAWTTRRKPSHVGEGGS